MESVGWIVAAVLAVIVVYLLFRGPSEPASTASKAAERAPAGGGDPAAADRSMLELARYLEKAVIAPLEDAADDTDFTPGVLDAIDALKDLVEYAGVSAEPANETENLLSVLQAVAREYTAQTQIPVRIHGPDRSIPVRIAPERFKDAVYLVLVNAGRFGGGRTIHVDVAESDDTADVSVRDSGPGFSAEALYRAFEPFWSSEDDALGLGLPHARRLIDAQGGSVSVGNASRGGGETVIKVRRA